MFSFFLKSYKSGILDFCGVNIITKLDLDEQEGKFCFRKFDNGEYTKDEIYVSGIKTRHPNILKAVIIGKKSWGLFLNEWSEGISECNFTLSEILYEFESRNIKIPDSLMIDFMNRINDKKRKKYI